jgi:hypothetical protein
MNKIIKSMKEDCVLIEITNDLSNEERIKLRKTVRDNNLNASLATALLDGEVKNFIICPSKEIAKQIAGLAAMGEIYCDR